MTAITAITAQNTVAVTSGASRPGEDDRGSDEGRGRDIGVDAVKSGMLGTEETIEAVGHGPKSSSIPGYRWLIDPVMVARVRCPSCLEPGERVGRSLERLFRAPPWSLRTSRSERTIHHRRPAPTTPTISPASSTRSARRIVVLTGGHRTEAVDLFYDGTTVVEIPGERHPLTGPRMAPAAHTPASWLPAWPGEDDPLDRGQWPRRLMASGRSPRDWREIGRGAGPGRPCSPRDRNRPESPRQPSLARTGPRTESLGTGEHGFGKSAGALSEG